MLSISTSGKSPATSRRIREYFEKRLNAPSLYTLGYEDEKPVPIENHGLPYPVYLLLEIVPALSYVNRKRGKLNAVFPC